MLPRIRLVINDASTRERTQNLLKDVDCVVSRAEGGTPFWDAVRQQADMLPIGLDTLPEPVADTPRSNSRIAG